VYSIFLPAGLILAFLLYWKVNYSAELKNSNLSDIHEKQRGAHVFSIRDTSDFQTISDYNFNWITVVSWGYQNDYDSPTMRHHSGDSLMMRSRDSSWVKRIELIRNKGYKVFVKPHVWISDPSDDKWRSDIFPSDKENWKLWQKSYRDFIIRYAKVAEQANAEMFCIGTELSQLATSKSQFWQDLIKEVKTVYSGKLTYAANWHNEYEKITFWDQLDYIGIQAYFPLVNLKNPTTEQLTKGWDKYLPNLESLYGKYNRRILFTEMGYKSTASSAIRPWEWAEKSTDKEVYYSPETQANCYKAFFESVWKQDWFAGVHIWQLRSKYNINRAKKDLDFTPQGKPAQQVIAEGFRLD